MTVAREKRHKTIKLFIGARDTKIGM